MEEVKNIVYKISSVKLVIDRTIDKNHIGCIAPAKHILDEAIDYIIALDNEHERLKKKNEELQKINKELSEYISSKCLPM